MEFKQTRVTPGIGDLNLSPHLPPPAASSSRLTFKNIFIGEIPNAKK
jgi:hypothetical protein